MLVTGEVRRRPAGNENPELPTGEIEVAAGRIEVLVRVPTRCRSRSTGTGRSSTRKCRLKYRYLDIRRADMAAALRARSTAAYLVSDVMRDHDFVNVETPFLTRSTPEGARDFLVPVRLQPGSWYALPQSPQLFKQLLMVSGMERYYQLVRCFRDEDFRADRQPEFTQVDIEMSFVTRADVIEVAEDLVQRLWREIAGYELPRPIPQMTYADAMARFGSDKPDLRFGCELIDLTQYFAGSGFRVFQAQHVGAVVMPGGAGADAQGARRLAGLGQVARRQGPGLRADRAATARCPTPGRWPGTCRTRSARGCLPRPEPGPVTACSSPRATPAAARTLLGAARLEIGERLRADRSGGVGVHLGGRRADVRR